MVIAAPLQPDQDAARWGAHAAAYEQVFEPLTNAFAARALALLAPLTGMRLLDVGAGAGGAAMLAARLGAQVTAVDASAAMVHRIAERAHDDGVRSIDALVQDGAALTLPDACIDRALSCFGVVLFPDPARGMAEIRRVLRRRGRAGIVTWTQPHRYELSARLRAATIAVCGTPAAGPLPAQLRFIEPAALRALLTDAGFVDVVIETLEAALHAPSARWLAAAMGFAPGMAAALDALGPARDAVLARFVDQLEADAGPGPVALGAVAHVATGTRP